MIFEYPKASFTKTHDNDCNKHTPKNEAHVSLFVNLDARLVPRPGHIEFFAVDDHANFFLLAPANQSTFFLIPKSSFVHMPNAPRPKISSQWTRDDHAEFKKPIKLFVANKYIREGCQNKHEAAPPQNSPV